MSGIRIGGGDISRIMNAGVGLSRVIVAGDTIWAPYTITDARVGSWYSDTYVGSWSLTFNAGSDKAVGDMVLVCVSVDGGRDITASRSDFQRIHAHTTDPALAVFVHYWDGATKTVTFDWAGTEDVAVTVLYFRDTTRDIGEIVRGPVYAGNSTTLVDLPALTAPGGIKEYMWVVCLASTSTHIDSVPDGWSGVTASSGSNATDAGVACLFYKSRTATLDPPSFRLAGSSPSWRALMLAIPPRIV